METQVDNRNQQQVPMTQNPVRQPQFYSYQTQFDECNTSHQLGYPADYFHNSSYQHMPYYQQSYSMQNCKQEQPTIRMMEHTNWQMGYGQPPSHGNECRSKQVQSSFECLDPLTPATLSCRSAAPSRATVSSFPYGLQEQHPECMEATGSSHVHETAAIQDATNIPSVGCYSVESGTSQMSHHAAGGEISMERQHPSRRGRQSTATKEEREYKRRMTNRYHQKVKRDKEKTLSATIGKKDKIQRKFLQGFYGSVDGVVELINERMAEIEEIQISALQSEKAAVRERGAMLRRDERKIYLELKQELNRRMKKLKLMGRTMEAETTLCEEEMHKRNEENKAEKKKEKEAEMPNISAASENREPEGADATAGPCNVREEVRQLLEMFNLETKVEEEPKETEPSSPDPPKRMKLKAAPKALERKPKPEKVKKAPKALSARNAPGSDSEP